MTYPCQPRGERAQSSWLGQEQALNHVYLAFETSNALKIVYLHTI
jgi:hypothetical protein